MKLKTKMIALAAFLAAMNVAASAQTMDTLSKGPHYTAGNCEIFIDKISAQNGSHAYRGLRVWVKVLPFRLDSEIVEVGFHNKMTGSSYSEGAINQDWRDKKMAAESPDYFSIDLSLSSDFDSVVYEGAFYVRTKAGTNYWLKPAGGGNFIFDGNAFNIIAKAMGYTNYNGNISAAVPTQRSDLSYYNSGVCY
jgi:hypothetical protein